MPNFKIRQPNAKPAPYCTKPAPYCAKPERKGGSCRGCEHSFDQRMFDSGCKLARCAGKRKK